MANTVAYGFLSLQHLFNDRVNEVGVERVYQAIQESLEQYNMAIDGAMGTMIEDTTVAQEQIELAGDGSLQPIDPETGNALPVQVEGYYQVAYPIQGGATAWGVGRVSGKMLTVEEANRRQWDSQQRDADWNRRHFLAAVFDNTAWTYNDKVGPGGAKGLGNITIQPLANNDTVTYNRRGAVAKATDNHYLAQANDPGDNDNPFPTIREELQEHPGNSGPIVAMIATDLRSDIENMATFVEVPDPGINYGQDTDQVNVSGIDIGPADELLGYIRGEDIYIAEWRSLPSSYLIAHSTGKGPFVKKRQYANSDLQGFFMEKYSPENGFELTQMVRVCGYGVSERTAAVVMYFGNSSYAIPTGYTTPLDR